MSPIALNEFFEDDICREFELSPFARLHEALEEFSGDLLERRDQVLSRFEQRIPVPAGQAQQAVSKEQLQAIKAETDSTDSIVSARSRATGNQNVVMLRNAPCCGTNYFPHLRKILERLGIDVLDGRHCRQTGGFWYPPKGYMGWHTNEDDAGIRCYLVFAREHKESFFRYQDPRDGRIVTRWDRQGWWLRRFRVGSARHRLWHCVYSNTDRISLGFAVTSHGLSTPVSRES